MSDLLRLRIVPVHPDPAAIVDELDPAQVTTVVLHALGAQHLATGGTLGAAYRL